ncbi:MAG TPA: hypothetical protein VHR86_06965, partial [Armatimonadota bacterium]|nr:hypothetical protein [Armatimonadota bacterium]
MTLSDLVQNLIPVAVVALLLFAVHRAGRTPLWGEAYRRLRSNRLALVALGVICLYGLIGFLDSVSWRDSRADSPRTVIDRLFERPKERTYSAPLALVTTGEPTPHRLRSRHLLGTDGVGSDTFYLMLKGCRTALIIGGFTSLIVTPLALFFGMMAGYFGKRVDDLIQYLYI